MDPYWVRYCPLLTADSVHPGGTVNTQDLGHGRPTSMGNVMGTEINLLVLLALSTPHRRHTGLGQLLPARGITYRTERATGRTCPVAPTGLSRHLRPPPPFHPHRPSQPRPSPNSLTRPPLPQAPPPAARQTAPSPPAPARRTRWLESLQENWMTWLGGISVALAGIFMVKYSIDIGLLGPKARVTLGILTGLALHAAAERLRRRTGGSNPVFAALAGGASITLYAALLAALHLYHLLDPRLVFVLLALVSPADHDTGIAARTGARHDRPGRRLRGAGAGQHRQPQYGRHHDLQPHHQRRRAAAAALRVPLLVVGRRTGGRPGLVAGLPHRGTGRGVSGHLSRAAGLGHAGDTRARLAAAQRRYGQRCRCASRQGVRTTPAAQSARACCW